MCFKCPVDEDMLSFVQSAAGVAKEPAQVSWSCLDGNPAFAKDLVRPIKMNALKFKDLVQNYSNEFSCFILHP